MGAAHSLDVSGFDADEQALEIRHRSDTETNLKNKQSGEHICALSKDVCEVLQDYIDVTRDDVTDDHGRKPLFTTRYGRMHRSKIREMVYAVARPCAYGQNCPYGRDPNSSQQARNVRLYNRLFPLQHGGGHTYEGWDGQRIRPNDREDYRRAHAIISQVDVTNSVKEWTVQKVMQENLTGFSRHYEGLDGAALGFATLYEYGNAEMAKDSYLVEEAGEMLSMPVRSESARADGRQPSRPDLLMRRGIDDSLRGVMFDARPTFPNPGCTTVTIYSHDSRQPGFIRRLLERLTF